MKRKMKEGRTKEGRKKGRKGKRREGKRRDGRANGSYFVFAEKHKMHLKCHYMRC